MNNLCLRIYLENITVGYLRNKVLDWRYNIIIMITVAAELISREDMTVN